MSYKLQIILYFFNFIFVYTNCILREDNHYSSTYSERFLSTQRPIANNHPTNTERLLCSVLLYLYTTSKIAIHKIVFYF